MNLFIDTNVFLSFYHLTSENLIELEKLVALIDDEKLKLFLPEQVIEETKRNRASKISNAFAPFKDTDFEIKFPAYCKNYGHYDDMRELIKNIKNLHKEMVLVIEKDIQEQKLKADLLLEKLFNAAIIIERSPEIINASLLRVNVGNPPGKKDSLGDAINWESLLSIKDRRLDINIITADSDFYSPLNKNAFSEFLLAEWKVSKRGRLKAYRKLSDCFKENFPDINLKTESEKSILINALHSSPNFQTTHQLIEQLSTFGNFTHSQGRSLVKALIDNNQINWIISDSDILDFYKKIDQNTFLEFEDFYEEFENLLKKGADVDEMEDDIPF